MGKKETWVKHVKGERIKDSGGNTTTGVVEGPPQRPRSEKE